MCSSSFASCEFKFSVFMESSWYLKVFLYCHNLLTGRSLILAKEIDIGGKKWVFPLVKVF